MSQGFQPHTIVFQGALLLLSTASRSFGSLILRHPNTTRIDGDLNANTSGDDSGQNTNPGDFPMAESSKSSRSLFRRKSTLLPLYAEPKSAPPRASDTSSLSGSTSSRGNPGRSETSETAVEPSSSSHSSVAPATLEKVDVEEQDQLRPGVSSEIAELVAVTSDEFERYHRDVKTDKHFWDEFIIDPLDVDFSRPEPQNEWMIHTHPEGALYFYNTSWEIPVLTDVHIYDRPSRERLENYIQNIFGYIKRHQLELPLDICLVLEFRLSGRCGYYFVDHKKQCLFWLDEFEATVFLNPIRVRYTPSLVNLKMKSLYWQHNEYFPDARPFPSDALLELRDMLIHAIGDSLTSSSTNAPYNLETLEKMLELVDKIESNKSRGPGSTTVIYRFLQNFYHERFLHLYGEQAARIDADQTIHPERPRTLLIKTLSPIFLFGPEVHLRKLKEISIDSLVRSYKWESLLQELTDEWKEFTLYATVLLNANVAFLAIQSVDSSAPPHGRSPMQRASYFSIITSLGAIVLGLLLVRQHNTTLDRSFLVNRSASVLGLETLAVMYSLPYALLMYGFVSFLGAFSLMCFGSHDVLTIVMILISGVTLLSLLSWTVSVSWEDTPFWYPWPFRLLKYFIKTEGKQAGIGRLKPPISSNSSFEKIMH